MFTLNLLKLCFNFLLCDECSCHSVFNFNIIDHILGASATVAALTVGIINLVKKNSRKQQIMMRYRIIAQGITFAALGYSVFFYQLKKFF